MAAFINEDMDFLHLNTHVFNASVEDVEQLTVIPNFFCKTWKIFVMYSCIWKSVLGVAACANLLLPVEFKDSSWSFLFPEIRILSIFVASSENVRLLRYGWSQQISLYQYDYFCPSSTFPGLTGYPKSCGGLSLALHGLRNTKLTGLAFAGKIGFRFAIGEPSLGSRFLVSLWHGALLSDRNRKKIAETAARDHQETPHVKQTKKMVALATRETLFGWHVSKWIFGVHISDVDFWFQVDSAEQPIKRSSVGSGHVSQCWTSPFHNHLDDSHVVFKKKKMYNRLALEEWVLVRT